MNSNTSKKLVAAVIVALISTIGVAAPADAAGPKQQARDIWCC